MMIGKKISLPADFLPKDLIKSLWKLNNNRLLLAHGITGREVPGNNPTLRTGQHFYITNKDPTIFTKDFLTKIINLATHATDTVVETDRVLGSNVKGKTVVLVDALIPYAFGASDALFNLGFAFSAVQALQPGVSISQ